MTAKEAIERAASICSKNGDEAHARSLEYEDSELRKRSGWKAIAHAIDADEIRALLKELP